MRVDDPLSREMPENVTVRFKFLLRSRLALKRMVIEYDLDKPPRQH